jgi:two-component system OmpR family sensor kinase
MKLRSSIRARLTLWHVAVLGLVLIGFSFALSYSVRTSLASAADDELADRAHFFTQRWEQAGSFGGPSRWPGRGGPGAPPGDSSQRRDTPPSTEAERRGYFRQPRIMDPEGHPMLPFGDEPWDPDAFHVALVGKDIYSVVTIDNEHIRVFSTPVGPKDDPEGVVQVAHVLTEQERLNAGLIRTLLTLVPIALLVAGIGGVFLTDRALRPVRNITQAAAQIGAEDLSQRLEVTGEDELGQLATTFNGMIGRLEEAFRRLEAAYEQQRRFTGDASHELRTPLTAIKANTSFALCGEHTPEDYRDALKAADEAADTMTRIVQDLLLLARSDSGQFQMSLTPADLDDVLGRAASAIRDRSAAPIHVRLAEKPTGVQGDSHHLMRLFLNLLENAARHTPGDGSITVTVMPGRDRVTVTVEDTGEGIPPEHLPHLCERFYRVDSARSRAQGGTGLGLAICQSIVAAHGGTMSFGSEVGKGTTVTVTLQPAALPQPALAAQA